MPDWNWNDHDGNSDMSIARRHAEHRRRTKPAMLSSIAVEELFAKHTEWPRWALEARQRCRLQADHDRRCFYVQTEDGSVRADIDDAVAFGLVDERLYVLRSSEAARYVECRP